MQFTTPVNLTEGLPKIDYKSKIISLGSCFAVNMGQKFNYYKLHNTTNPFGILFSPSGLEKVIGFAVNKKTFTEADIFFHNERWQCFDTHSDLSNNDTGILIEKLNSAGSLLADAIQQATHIIITLGTAWVYRQNTTGNLVANCHKVPQKEFTKEILSVEAIKKSLQNILVLIHSVNKNAKVIFTVSPVRHIKDGFTENQWSKANLISGLHEALQIPQFGAGGHYFASYEIMMDELRDYRFYAEDMIHPNQTAINYIWERFADTWISDDAKLTMNNVDNIQKSLLHRPFNHQSESHKKFLKNLQDKIMLLQQTHPHIKF